MIQGWLKLLALRGLSNKRKRGLVDQLGSIEELYQLSRPELKRLLADKPQVVRQIEHHQTEEQAGIESDLRIMGSLDVDYIAFTDPSFPPLLNQIPDPPLGLFVRGNAELLSSPQLAIVGSRSPSPAGLANARAFAADLAQTGLTITSGLALGIDANAHIGALQCNQNTIAVMATGADKIYPQGNRGLAAKIVRHGCLATEFPPATPPRRQYFPQRNRLISGLSLSTLVVEAGVRSGSLITARLAAEQGREVFAIPGSIHLPTSRGCHHLIRQGARLVETTQDILDEIGHYFVTDKHAKATPTAAQELDPNAAELLQLIDYAPTSIDQIIINSGLTAAQVSSILVALELTGKIAAMPGGAFQRLS